MFEVHRKLKGKVVSVELRSHDERRARVAWTQVQRLISERGIPGEYAILYAKAGTDEERILCEYTVVD